MSYVTKKELKRLFNTENVKQYGSKSLFLVDGNKLVSYKTVVARLIFSPGGKLLARNGSKVFCYNQQAHSLLA